MTSKELTERAEELTRECEGSVSLHFFWFHEACVALDQMRLIATDVSKQGTDEFALAKARFAHARNRCKLEYATLCLNAVITNAIHEVAEREAADE